MSVTVPTVEEIWKRLMVHEPSLMTPLGLLSGEVLTYLEAHGATPMRRLIRELSWPSTMVTMAVGALVREGLAQAVQHDLEVIVEIRRAGAIAAAPVPAKQSA